MESQAFLNGGIQPKRYRAGGVGNWSGHLPFAYDLIGAAAPGLLVELGTHYGESYFGFCQAIAEKNIACSCYAVDSWTGEVHAGFYDESVYLDVTAYNQASYSDFSYLLRTTFDNALSNFADESIDLLHIDGLHTYEAVSHDLQSWLPKVKPGGIILMHDIMARHGDFGVWNVWRELADTGSHFAFSHNWGLGVFRKPGGAPNTHELLTALFDSVPETQEHVRKFYALCATKLEYEYHLAHRVSSDAKVLAQIYTAGTDGHSGDRCLSAYVTRGIWDHFSVELPTGFGIDALRLDPADCAGVIDIAGIVIRRLVDNETLWSARTSSELAGLTIGGDLKLLEGSQDHSFCRFVSHGTDPQVFIPSLDASQFDQPLSLEVWLRVQTDVSAVLSAVQVPPTPPSASHSQKELEAIVEDRNAHAQQSVRLTAERDTLLASCHKLQSELYVAKTDLKHMALDEQRRVTEQQERFEQEAIYRTEIDNLRAVQADLRERLAVSEATLHGAVTSRSWRITAPMRNLITQLSRLRGA